MCNKYDPTLHWLVLTSKLAPAPACTVRPLCNHPQMRWWRSKWWQPANTGGEQCGVRWCAEGEAPTNCVQSAMESRYGQMCQKAWVGGTCKTAPRRVGSKTLQMASRTTNAMVTKRCTPTPTHALSNMPSSGGRNTSPTIEQGNKRNETWYTHNRDIQWLLLLLSCIFQPLACAHKPWISFQPVSSSTNSPSSPADMYLTRWYRSFGTGKRRHTKAFLAAGLHESVLVWLRARIDSVFI